MNTVIEKNIASPTSTIAHVAGGCLEIPDAFRTLQASMDTRASSTKPITFINKHGQTYSETYQGLIARARMLGDRLATVCARRGIKEVMIHFDDPCDIATVFWACIHAGITAVPMGPLDAYRRGHAGSEAFIRIWEYLNRPLIVCANNLQERLLEIVEDFQVLEMEVVAMSQLAGADDTPGASIKADRNDIALILFTSGSTGTPKGVPLSHANIVAGVFGLNTSNDFTENDINLNWLSMNHAAGLIVHHIGKLILGCEQIQVAGSYILEDPLRWLDLLERFQVTGTWAPNFAFAQVNKKLSVTTRHWDLRRLRLIGAGAEPTNVETVYQFLRHLAKFGVTHGVMCNGWGMSETAGCVTKPELFVLNEKVATTTVLTQSMRYGAQVTLFDESGPGTVTFADCGLPVPGLEMRIVDEDGDVVAEGVLGSLQVRGECVITRYLASEKVNQELFQDGWLRTGDLGFIYGGNLVLTGREKDIVIINGVNHSNSEIEQIVERLDGVRPSFTVACGVRDRKAETDVLAVLYSPANSTEDMSARKDLIRKTVLEKMGLVPYHLYAVRPADIAKTPIGKLQRSRMSEMLHRWIDAHVRISRQEWKLEVSPASSKTAMLQPHFDEVVLLNFEECSARLVGLYQVFVPKVSDLQHALLEKTSHNVRRIALIISVPPRNPDTLTEQLSNLRDWLMQLNKGGGRVELIVFANAANSAESIGASDYLASPAISSMILNWGLQFGNLDTWVRYVTSVDEPEKFLHSPLGPADAPQAKHDGINWRVPSLLPSAPDSALYPQPLQPAAGTRYLIIGGFGGIGAQLTEYLVFRGASSISVVGRSASRGLADFEAAMRQKFSGISELPTIDAIDLDLNRTGANIKLIELLKNGPSVDGVIFCAGTWDTLLNEQSNTNAIDFKNALILIDEFVKFLHVLRPKWNFVFGAIASQLRSFGSAYYSAVSAVLENGVSFLRGSGLQIIFARSAPWEQTGMSARLQQNSSNVFENLSAKNAIDAIDEALRTGLDDFILGTPKSTAFINARDGQLLLTDLDPSYIRTHQLQPQKKLSIGESVEVVSEGGSLTELQQLVGAAVGVALDLSQVSLDDDFFALGGSSLQIAIVNSVLQKKGYWIRPGKFFEARLIERIASEAEFLSAEDQAKNAGADTPLKTGHVDVDSIQIYFEYYGTGDRPVVVFVNGMFMNTTSWRPFLPNVIGEYDVILWDMRGQGQSTFDDAPYSTPGSAMALHKILLHLDIRTKVNLLCISLGSYVALEFALQFPEHANSIVISGASLTSNEIRMQGTEEEIKLLDSSVEEWARNLVPRLMALDFIPAEFVTNRVASIVASYGHRKFSARRLLVSLLEYLTELPGIIPDLQKIHHPVLVIAGAEDQIAPAALQREMKTVLRNFDYKEYPKTGHLPQLEKPDLFFNDALQHFAKSKINQ